MEAKIIQDEWEILKRFLPKDWEAKATGLGALTRKRKITNASTLLRLLLIHFADGKSLRTTTAYAEEVNLCSINDVALLHRLKASEEWLRWMASELLNSLNRETTMSGEVFKKYRVRLVDGSSVSEQGSTGSDWKIHYCFQLNTLKCDTVKITTPKEGETFKRYDVREGDLIIGDRGYCHRQGIMHVINNKGDVLVRFQSTNVALFDRKGRAFPVLEKLRSLNEGEIGDWDVWLRSPEDNELVKGRLSTIRKSNDAIEKGKKEIRKEASRRGRKTKPETLEYAEYIMIFTTLNRHNVKGESVLSLYRGRWQIELVFKRLKGIIRIGHLPKYNPESCVAWLYGKMVVALLVERLYQEAEFISPWGYPI
ncbi:MAG: IS4 family transposase [Nitrospirae bacterium]|nr:IS4 family transposase [Nitrospirota bacterium]MBF0536014.1 IS4 family transposase [Nitrospirota bacterium]